MSLAGGHVLPVSVPVFPWPLPHVSASSPLLIRTVVFGFRVTIPDDQSSDRPFCIPGSRVGAKVYPQPAASHLCHSQGQGLGTWAPAARGPSGASGAAWCKRGARLSEAHMVSQLPTAPFFIQPRPLGHAFRAVGRRSAMDAGEFTQGGPGASGVGVCMQGRQSPQPLSTMRDWGQSPTVTIHLRLCAKYTASALSFDFFCIPSSRSGWQSCPCFAHTLQGLLPLLRPVPTSC